MLFDPFEPLTPVGHIHEIEIVLKRTVDPDDPEGPESVRYRISVYNQLDQPVDHKPGDLIPHAPQAIKDALQQIMDWAWQKAEDEVLPPP